MFRYLKLLDRVANLALKVSELESRLSALEFRQADGADLKEEATDKVLEWKTKKFTDGLNNLLAFDGTPQEEINHGNE